MATWVKQWKVPSDSHPGDFHTVSLSPVGWYACSCGKWRFQRGAPQDRRPCPHIEDVRDGKYPAVGEVEVAAPDFVYANVREVTPRYEGGQLVRVLLPLLPFGDTGFLATLAYDLLALGLSWALVRRQLELPRKWTREAVLAHVQHHGRRIYGPWVEGRGHEGYETVPVNGAE